DDRKHPRDAFGSRQADDRQKPVPGDEDQLDRPLQRPKHDAEQIESTATGVGAGRVCEQKVKTHCSVLSSGYDESVRSQVVSEVSVRADVVDAAFAPRVAAQDAPRGENRSPQGTVLLNRPYSVCGTRGVIPAYIPIER